MGVIEGDERMAVKKQAPLLGAHMSIAGGVDKAVERAVSAGCNVLQIFVKNNNRWNGVPLLPEVVERFQKNWKAAGLRSVVAHAAYLINLASPRRELWERSIAAVQEELERCERLGLDFLIIHPGAHLGEGETAGIERVARALDRIHDKCGEFRVRLALESTAGQGTTLGYRFEHLRDILEQSAYPDLTRVCVDTCHIFAAGYDIRSEEAYRETIGQFDETVGLEKLKVFHFNDSKREMGSRVDRHHHIGKGKIGENGFRWILNDPRFVKIPKILETPKGDDLKEDKRNLKVLRSLVGSDAGI